MPAVIRVLVLAVVAALVAGCHLPREGGPARVARLKQSAAALDREEPQILAAVDRKKASYDARLAEGDLIEVDERAGLEPPAARARGAHAAGQVPGNTTGRVPSSCIYLFLKSTEVGA